MVELAQVAALFAIVAPLYGSTFMIYHRLGKLAGTGKQADANEDAISDIELQLGRVEEKVDVLHADHLTFQQQDGQGDRAEDEA